MARNPIDLLMDTIEWIPLEGTIPSDVTIPYATHSGTIQLGEFTLKCFQLSDGMRVLDAEDVERLLGLDPHGTSPIDVMTQSKRHTFLK